MSIIDEMLKSAARDPAVFNCTRSPAVAVYFSAGLTMVADWVEAVVVSRGKRGTFSVFFRKLGDWDDDKGYRWRTEISQTGLRGVEALAKALSNASCDIAYEEAVAEIARLDPQMAQALADRWGVNDSDDEEPAPGQ